MDKSLTASDWSLIRAFLAVAETGSLSAAARDLGASQPTLGRQIRQLEDDLKQVLFNRQARGLSLSKNGEALLASARKMRAAMHEIELTAMGQQAELAGTVRITASEMVSQYHLPPIIADIRRAEPGIQIEIVATDSTDNLLFREADIAIRMYRPEQLELVATHLGDVRLGLYASTAFLDDVGRPKNVFEAFQLPLIGYDRNEMLLQGMQERGFNATKDWFPLRCDCHPVIWQLIREGCGLGITHAEVAERDPLVEELDLPMDIPVLPVWLVTHQALRHTPRIALVWEALAQGLRARLV